jgi:YbbR-like protein
MDLRWLRSIVAENLNLKLLSLAFALVLYSVVHASQDAQRSLLVSVVALTPPETSNRVLMTVIPATIRITVRGPRSTIDELHADDIANVQLDLRGGNEARVLLDPSMIPMPPGVKVEQIDPPEIPLVWEDLIVRDVPVEVGVVGTPAPGFVVKGAPLADPPTVRAHGPKSEVMLIQRARADAFDVAGLTEGKSLQLAIERPPGRVTFDVPSIRASVEIAREVVERLFTKVPVAVIGHANAKSQPAEVDVRLACPPEVARPLRAEQLVPRVQIVATTDHGSDSLPVQLTIDQCAVHVIPPTVVARW